jgi:16S rRNA G1207 methylase RsmC
MNLAGQLLAHYPHDHDHITKIKQRRMAFLLAGTAAVHVHMGNTTHAASLHLAKKMLNFSAAAKDELEATVAQLQAGQTSGTDVLMACSNDSGVMDAYTYLQEFHVAANLKDAAWQEAILEAASHAAAVTADHLLLMAGVCKSEASRYA